MLILSPIYLFIFSIIFIIYFVLFKICSKLYQNSSNLFLSYLSQYFFKIPQKVYSKSKQKLPVKFLPIINQVSIFVSSHLPFNETNSYSIAFMFTFPYHQKIPIACNHLQPFTFCSNASTCNLLLSRVSNAHTPLILSLLLRFIRSFVPT